MNNLLETCTNCYEIRLPECCETIKMQAGLEKNSYYWYQLENRFGQKFTDRVQTDENGYLSIDLTRFANYQALFSHTAGTFTLSIVPSQANCGSQPLSLCGQEYGCVKITFDRVFNVSDDMLTAVIPCECPEEDRGGENPPPPPPPPGPEKEVAPRPSAIYITENREGEGNHVDQIIVNGVELLSAPVLAEYINLATQAALVNAINLGTGIHGFSAAYNSGQHVVYAPIGTGASLNGITPVMSFSGALSGYMTPFSDGVDGE